MINFNTIKKYIISLKRRTDRRDLVSKEMAYMGWDYTFFDAIDTDSYEGCALSHMEIAKLLLESNDDYILVLEDDTFFMPYARDMISKVEKELNSIEWDFFTLCPSVHRPLFKTDNILINLSSFPPRDENIHRGIFGTSGLLYSRKIAEIISKWNTCEYIINDHKQNPIDVYIDLAVLPNYKSFCARYPICTQRNSLSDINHTIDNNHFKIMYNWRQYGINMPAIFDDQDYCHNLKKINVDGEHYDISICNI